MEAKRKEFYEAPATEVVEVKAEGFICNSNNVSAIWAIGGENFSNPTADWGRSGYGSAQDL